MPYKLFLGLVILSFLLLLGCSTSQNQTSDVTTTPVSTNTETKVTTPPKAPITKAPITKASASPVGGAVQAMQKANQQMLETMQLLGTLEDQVYDCQNRRQESFQAMQKFFGQHCFDFDEEQFWFLTASGQKVGVRPSDGVLAKAKTGYFTSYRELVTYQSNGDALIQTDFYMDCTKGELIVHRYVNNDLMSTETFNLAGY